MKLQPTKVFCSYAGYSKDNIKISYGHITLQREDLRNIPGVILSSAKKNNGDIENVHIISIVALELVSVI